MAGARWRAIGVAAVVIAAAWLTYGWWNSDGRRIRRKVDRIQELVAKNPGESALVGLDKARRITELFAEPFEFRARPYNFSARDRRSLAAGIHSYRSTASQIRMLVRRHDLHVDDALRRATSDLTADFLTDIGDLAGREGYRFQINWVERDGDWWIDYVDLLEVF